MRIRCASWAVCVVLSCWVGVAQAQQYMGAREVLARMRKPPAGPASGDPKTSFYNDLADFGDRAASLAPQEAATDWLALVRRSLALTEAEGEMGSTGRLTGVLKALPGPDSWPLVEERLRGAEAMQGPRNHALLLLMDVLQDKYDAALAEMKAVPQDSVSEWELRTIRLGLAVEHRDADGIEAALKHEADDFKTTPRLSREGGPSIEVPDLVPLIGAVRAEKLLTTILTTAKAELRFTEGGPSVRSTADLARKIALRDADRLAWPQWTLAQSPDAGELFPLFRKRFPKVTMGVAFMNPASWTTYNDAAVSRFVNLYVAGRMAEVREFATAYAADLTLGWGGGAEEDGLLRPLWDTGRLEAFFSFLGSLALKHPDSALPSLYMSLAGQNQDPASYERFLKRLIGSAAQDYVRDNAEGDLRTRNLHRGNLRAYAALLSNPMKYGPDAYDSGADAKLMFELAADLNRPDFAKRGLDSAEESLKGDMPSADEELIEALVKHGRGPKVEKDLIDALRAAMNLKGVSSPPAGQTAGLALAEFYFQIGRFKDVVALLERFPGWEASDLAELSDSGRGELSVLYMAAKSLAAVGRKAEAERILDYDLAFHPRDDAEYALLLDIDPKGAARTIDELHRAFPTDARPLIWKAVYLLRAQDLAEAETAARRAIASDPDDLEAWSKPKRFKAYEVLAAIEKAEGRAKEAQDLVAYTRAAVLARQAKGLSRWVWHGKPLSSIAENWRCCPTTSGLDWRWVSTSWTAANRPTQSRRSLRRSGASLRSAEQPGRSGSPGTPSRVEPLR